MKTCHRLSTLTAILSIVAWCSHQPSIAELEKGFIHPPDSAKPHVCWHWLNGNVSREGISRDLEAMAEQGIGGASVFNLREQADPGPVIYGSAAWQRLVDHAFAEAKRLGLQLSFQNCGGWATSGGPWVSPDQAMKKLVYGKVRVKGPQKFSGSLPRPVGFDDYYRDVVILAYAQHDQGPSRMRTALAGIFCDNNTLLHRLVVKDKKLCLPNGAAYRLLVLPESLPCTPVLLAKIKDLVEAGAALYGPKPIHSPSLTDCPAADKEVKKLAKEIWGKDDGREIGTLWRPPYNIEISDFINPGRNTLRVEVANTWVNRIVGDLNRKTAKTYTWSNSTHHYNKDSPLSRSGLIGPVFLRFSEIIAISHESKRRKK